MFLNGVVGVIHFGHLDHYHRTRHGCLKKITIDITSPVTVGISGNHRTILASQRSVAFLPKACFASAGQFVAQVSNDRTKCGKEVVVGSHGG